MDRLSTKDIRLWHEQAGGRRYSVNRALSILQAVLALRAEDAGTRPVAMPNGLARNVTRASKAHLSVEQARTVVKSGDIYVAFPFLVGTRISEQLGLCWDCVDFDAGVVHIRRVQDKRSGELIGATKTASSQRSVPMGEAVRRMLAGWKTICPSPERVFPAKQGGTLLYSNFLHRIWKPTLERMGLPPVSIHSARTSFISMLQENGTPVATAAKLAGHSNVAVTLSHYTHSLTDGREAIAALDAALTGTTPGTTGNRGDSE